MKDEPTPRQAAEEKATLWDSRLRRGTKAFEAWEKKFDCATLDHYYEGDQWKGLSEAEAAQKYVLNLVFATVETQLPSLLFSSPKIKAEPRVQHQETNNSQAGERATLIEQALQTSIDDPKIAFTFETTLALRDAYSRFAVVEVGYSADWIDNPNAGKPIQKSDDEKTPLTTSDGAAVVEPKKKLRAESVYVTRLAPENLRVFPGRNRLETNDWVAYGEWFDIADVKANPNFKNTGRLKVSGGLKYGEDIPNDDETRDEAEKHRGQVRIWRIWDLRAKVRHVLAEGQKLLLQEDKPFETLPLAVLKFFERRNSFFPLPPIYNWLAPQDEINEGREMQKIHRRRAKRLYMVEPGVNKDELAKMEDAPDMGVIEVPKVEPTPIAPIPSAPLGAESWTELAVSKEDFGLITGVSGEARGVPDSPTATQANIVNVRAGLRESRARAQVATWLGQIARLMLLSLRQCQLPMLVKQQLDPFAATTDIEAVARTMVAWKQIKGQDLADLDVEITVDVASLSPVALEAQREAWNTFVVPLIVNAEAGQVIFMPNPATPQAVGAIFRKLCVLNGITNETEIREIWRVGSAVQAARAAAAQAAQAAALAKPNINFSLKGEDLADPLVLQEFLRAAGLTGLASALALKGGGSTSAPGEADAAPAVTGKPGAGPTTGTPAPVAAAS